ncbi:MAG: hypothetical protein U5L11_08430 [Arhodomonas sp.]|nr:hypothetical protein [Arhodomonas sp.]
MQQIGGGPETKLEEAEQGGGGAGVVKIQCPGKGTTLPRFRISLGE